MESLDVQANEADVFDLRPANDWMKEAGDERAKMLFGELWMSGELCVMFGEAGVGKSLLAVQIADAIARGRALPPFGLDARAQKVLYVDLEKTASQFRQRYTETESKGSGRRRRYTFSKRFQRMAPKNGGEVRVRDIERVIEKSGAKVLIIDNLPHMLRGGLSREAAGVMRDLRRLRSAYGLSILVLANAVRSTTRRGIAAADMAWATALAALADNIFAIGRCGSQSGSRYIKHIKPRSGPLVYGTAAVPRFEIEQVNGTYPSFVHDGFGIEATLRAGSSDEHEWTMMKEIKKMSDEEGLSIREIAADICMPKSTVHRYLQMARQTIESEPLQFYGIDSCIDELCTGCDICDGRPGHINHSISGTIFGHNDCPDDCDICGPRAYREDEEVEPELRRRSGEFYEKLRAWLHGGKNGERPVYDGARRYGVARASWFPGSENWPEEEVEMFDKLCRKLHSHDAALGELEHRRAQKAKKPRECRSPRVSKGLTSEPRVTPSLTVGLPHPGGSECRSPRVSKGVTSELSVTPSLTVGLPAPDGNASVDESRSPRVSKDGTSELRVKPLLTRGLLHPGPFLYDGSPEAEAWFRELVAKHPDRSDTDILRDYERGEEWCRPPGALPPYDPEDPFADMEHSTDDYGREIFVEHRTDDGRPAVWYQYNSAGILQKKTRTPNGIQIEKANVNLFGKRVQSKTGEGAVVQPVCGRDN